MSWINRTVERLLEDPVTVLARGKCLARLGQDSPGDSIGSESVSIQYLVDSPIARTCRSRNKGLDMREAPITITPNDSLVKILLPSWQLYVLLA